MSALSPTIRILLRVFAGYLIGRGMDPDAANMIWLDDSIVAVLALGVSECWYFMARKFGWSK